MGAAADDCVGSGRLTPVGDALRGIATLPPAAARSVPIALATGAVLAEPLIAARPMPPTAIALRAGFAVNAEKIAGASAQSPVILSDVPPRVSPGEQLPPGFDAVVPPSAITSVGAMTLVTDTVPPGFDARLAGQDVGAGTLLATAGTRLTLHAILACRLAGIETAIVRRPRVSIEIQSQTSALWLGARLAALGTELVPPGYPSDLFLLDAGSHGARLALFPGDTASVSVDEARVRIGLPQRFDGLVAAYAALVLPALAHLLGLHVRTERWRLARKIASAIGMTEIALLRTGEDDAIPLAVGDLTLSALAEADAFALIPAGLEGYRAGDVIGVTRFEHPFTDTCRGPGKA